jgi:hypothetical protein
VQKYFNYCKKLKQKAEATTDQEEKYGYYLKENAVIRKGLRVSLCGNFRK